MKITPAERSYSCECHYCVRDSSGNMPQGHRPPFEAITCVFFKSTDDKIIICPTEIS